MGVSERSDRDALTLVPRDLDTADTTGMRTRVQTRFASREEGATPSRRYFILEEIGSGAFATVHKAIDVDTGELLAAKVILTNGPSWKWQRIKREFEVLPKTTHVT